METCMAVSRDGTPIHITATPQPTVASVHHPRHGTDGKGPVSLRPIQTREGFAAHNVLNKIKQGHHASGPIKLESAFAKAGASPSPGVKGPVKLESGSASKLALKSAAPLKLK